MPKDIDQKLFPVVQTKKRLVTTTFRLAERHTAFLRAIAERIAQRRGGTRPDASEVLRALIERAIAEEKDD